MRSRDLDSDLQRNSIRIHRHLLRKKASLRSDWFLYTISLLSSGELFLLHHVYFDANSCQSLPPPNLGRVSALT